MQDKLGPVSHQLNFAETKGSVHKAIGNQIDDDGTLKQSMQQGFGMEAKQDKEELTAPALALVVPKQQKPTSWPLKSSA